MAKTIKLPDNVPPRLQFQIEAASIQLDITNLVKKVQQLFRRLQTEGTWTSRTDDAKATSLVTGFWVHKGRWDALEPPEQLRPLWVEISDGFNELGLLMEKIPLLAAVGTRGHEEDLRDGLSVLRGEFTERLELLNGIEARLLAEEVRLRTEFDAKRDREKSAGSLESQPGVSPEADE